MRVKPGEDVNTSELTTGIKFDGEKHRTDLIPVLPLIGLAELYRVGALKYDDRDWEKGMAFTQVYGAALRHLFAWWNGEEYDPENGQHHLDAATFNIFALREYLLRNKGEDDRPHHEGPTVSEMVAEMRAVQAACQPDE